MIFTLAEIAKNDGKSGANTWVVYKNSVYDISAFLKEHPGGVELIEEYAGKDCTKAFDDFGHSGDAKTQLKLYKIGELSEEDRGKKGKKEEKSSEKAKEAEGSTRSLCYRITCGLFG